MNLYALIVAGVMTVSIIESLSVNGASARPCPISKPIPASTKVRVFNAKEDSVKFEVPLNFIVRPLPGQIGYMIRDPASDKEDLCLDKYHVPTSNTPPTLTLVPQINKSDLTAEVDGSEEEITLPANGLSVYKMTSHAGPMGAEDSYVFSDPLRGYVWTLTVPQGYEASAVMQLLNSFTSY